MEKKPTAVLVLELVTVNACMFRQMIPTNVDLIDRQHGATKAVEFLKANAKGFVLIQPPSDYAGLWVLFVDNGDVKRLRIGEPLLVMNPSYMGKDWQWILQLQHVYLKGN